MKKWVFLTWFLGSAALAGNSIPEIAQRCGPLTSEEKVLYSSEFKWGYDLPSLLAKYIEVYKSPKRLPKRAFWDTNRQALKLPYDSGRGGDIEINETFVQTIVRHVERAFELKYVDAVFFPDMGHSHLLIPEALYRNKYDKYPVNKMTMMYEDMFKDDRINILYHTAEQLQTLDKQDRVLPDPKIRWRFQTRNIVGRNEPTTDLRVLQNPESKANTVGGEAGYAWWGGGFNISGNQKGCFEYRAHGKIYYFDLSMYDLEPDSENGGWGSDQQIDSEQILMQVGVCRFELQLAGKNS